jgi:hypothetical protein
MSIETVIAEIDTEIARLQQAHALLAGMVEAAGETPAPAKKVAKRRKLSAATQKKIAAAQRKR